MAEFDPSKPLPSDSAALTVEDIEAFAASLEASVEAFRSNPPVALKPLPQIEAPETAAPAVGSTIDVDSPAETATTFAPPTAAPPTAAPVITPTAAPGVMATGGGLLEELRLAAAQRVAVAERERQEREQKLAQIGQAMRQMWNYFNELSHHLDVLMPAVPQCYRLGSQVEISGLAWSDSFSDYRSLNHKESAPLDTISLHYTLSAPGTIRVQRLPQHVQQLRDELAQVGLRYALHEVKNARGSVESVIFAIERQVKVTLLFKAQYDAGRIVFRGKNFDGLGPVTYELPPEQVGPPLLDEFAACILGRPNRLFGLMTAIKFNG